MPAAFFMYEIWRHSTSYTCSKILFCLILRLGLSLESRYQFESEYHVSL